MLKRIGFGSFVRPPTVGPTAEPETLPVPLTADPTTTVERWARRLSQLGLTLLQLDGAARLLDCHAPHKVVGQLLDTPLMRNAMKRALSASARPDASRALLPGARLVVLEEGAWHGDRMTLAALVLDRTILSSEELGLTCDQASLDLAAASTQLRSAGLPTSDAAARIITGLGWMIEDRRELQTHRGELRHLSDQLANNYEELSLLYRLSCGMTLDQPADLFLRGACRELHEVSGLDWMSLHLSPDLPRLKELRGRAYAAGSARDTAEIDALGRELIQLPRLSNEPLIVDDVQTLGLGAAVPSSDLLVVPLTRDGQTLGIIFGGCRDDGQPLDSTDAKLCASMGNSLAIFLENHMLYGDAQSLFTGTLHALTSAIDAKDSYTFGHSARVALLSGQLAEAAGHPPELVRRVILAGQVHDVGKIGVPEAVLCKPGRLTDEEFEAIKSHPTVGAKILRDIPQMADLIPGVLYHHEKYDGRGYPTGLAGQDIPLFGRIIGICDAFDAMSSNRTYRSALGHDTVLKEIRRCAGTQFDPELAELFVQLNFEPFRNLLKQHHTQLVKSQVITSATPDSESDSVAEKAQS